MGPCFHPGEKMHRQEPFRTRSVRLLELWECSDWRLKVYGIAYAGEWPRPSLVAAAKMLAPTVLATPAVTADRYGVGFVGVHEGRGANVIFASWWANENELRHHMWLSPGDDPAGFQYVTPSGFVGCVWDLSVVGFERSAWVDSVLAPPVPDFTAYMRAAFNADI
jgi:hypothetical protein